MAPLLAANDVFVFSDADEILSRESLEKMKRGHIKLPAIIRPPLYKYSLHWVQSLAGQGIIVATAAWAKQFHDWQGMRALTYISEHPENHCRQVRCCGCNLKTASYSGPGTGWHTSTFGSLEQIHEKSLSNIVEDHSRVYCLRETERRVRDGISMAHSTDCFDYIEEAGLSASLPRLAATNLEAFRTLSEWGTTRNPKTRCLCRESACPGGQRNISLPRTLKGSFKPKEGQTLSPAEAMKTFVDGLLVGVEEPC
jgi:hypothetical protein